jgi:hypothetical protein
VHGRNVKHLENWHARDVELSTEVEEILLLSEKYPMKVGDA